jgi:hypothetical protein
MDESYTVEDREATAYERMESRRDLLYAACKRFVLAYEHVSYCTAHGFEVGESDYPLTAGVLGAAQAHESARARWNELSDQLAPPQVG